MAVPRTADLMMELLQAEPIALRNNIQHH